MKKINIRLDYKYDGSAYFGFQRQPNKKTVQNEIEKILRIITKEDINLISAGRTDRGVHANHQVSNFLTSSKVPIEKFKYILNNSLPKDIYVDKVREVKETFNSRFDAKFREYEYLISWKKNPFEARYYKYFPEKIDIKILEDILKPFIGLNNFKNFMLSDKEQKVTIREIDYIKLNYLNKNKLKITIRGSSFLRSQIRIMVGTALQIYTKKLPDDYIKLLLNDFSKDYKKILAEPEGLYLNKIGY